MQAFQAKSDLREPETEDDFYKSFNEAEEEQRLKKEESEQAPTETGEFLKTHTLGYQLFPEMLRIIS